MLLRNRAETLAGMTDRITHEFVTPDDIIGGDTKQATEKPEKGLPDFAVLAETPDRGKWDAPAFPEADMQGMVFRQTIRFRKRDHHVG